MQRARLGGATPRARSVLVVAPSSVLPAYALTAAATTAAVIVSAVALAIPRDRHVRGQQARGGMAKAPAVTGRFLPAPLLTPALARSAADGEIDPTQAQVLYELRAIERTIIDMYAAAASRSRRRGSNLAAA